MADKNTPVIFKSRLGLLLLFFANDKLTAIKFAQSKKLNKKSTTLPFAKQTIDELKKYFNDGAFQFTLPYTFTTGTPFEQSVWQALKKIPAGKTLTYQELATQLKTSPRAVGNALAKNPLPIILPCHRIVAKNGIGGYSGKTAGDMLAIKVWLLNHEK